MILTISEAARRAGGARSTLYEMKLRGAISFIQSAAGKQGIDLSELSRVFPHVVSPMPTEPTQGYSHLQSSTESEIRALQEKVERLEQALTEEKTRGVKSEERVDLLLHLTQEQSKQLLLTHQNPQGFFQRLFGAMKSKG